MVGNTTIKRLYTGTLWAEGPAWNGVGRYLVWSDIPNNVQMRWIGGGRPRSRCSAILPATATATPSTSKGGSFPASTAAAAWSRYEYNGTVTVIADKFGGKRLNSPNDIVVHPDGGIWFTDPTYGIQGTYEGFQATPEMKQAVYRVDPKTGRSRRVTDEIDQPNGICFSPDYKKVYIADTGSGREIQSIRSGRKQAEATANGSCSFPAATDRGRRHALRRRRESLGRSALPECRLSRPAANPSA